MSELVLGFAILAIFILARRMNRDEDIIVDLRDRIKKLEKYNNINQKRGE